MNELSRRLGRIESIDGVSIGAVDLLNYTIDLFLDNSLRFGYLDNNGVPYSLPERVNGILKTALNQSEKKIKFVVNYIWENEKSTSTLPNENYEVPTRLPSFMRQS